MQKQIISVITLLACFVSTSFLMAQNRQPLLGSGKIVSLQPAVAAFDKVRFTGMNAQVIIEIGKPKCLVTIQADDNLAQMLTTTVNRENELTIALKDNANNRLWVEGSNIVIRVEMPEASVVAYEGNGSVTVNGIVGRYFRLEKEGNGGVVLRGSTDALDIKKSGNGSVNAAELVAKSAKVTSMGNGSVSLNASMEFSAVGQVLERDEWEAVKKSTANLRRIHVTFVNAKSLRSVYYVTGTNESGGKFSYGLELTALGEQKEYLPVGTKIYKKGKFLYELTEKDENQLVRL
jgi:hypothetical protein